jgi:hypothetical protein
MLVIVPSSNAEQIELTAIELNHSQVYRNSLTAIVA